MATRETTAFVAEMRRELERHMAILKEHQDTRDGNIVRLLEDVKGKMDTMHRANVKRITEVENRLTEMESRLVKIEKLLPKAG